MGTISTAGLYTAPAELPSPATATVIVPQNWAVKGSELQLRSRLNRTSGWRTLNREHNVAGDLDGSDDGSSGTLEIVGEHSAATAALVDITMNRRAIEIWWRIANFPLTN